MTEILRIESLTAGYRGAAAIEEIGFSAKAGSVVALLGANGAGKSTLLKCIAGLMPTFSGRIWFEGRDVTGRSAIELVRAGIAYVPEGREIVTTLSVNENLTLGGLHVPKAVLEQRRELVLRLFPELVERLSSPSWQLSGGQQQMLAIGRALMAGPKVLLLDEPSLGLAPLLVQRVFNQLGELQRQFNLTVVLVEQNYRLTMRVADTAYFMRSGRIVGHHSAEELRTPEGYGKIISAYFGAAASAA
ncbi:MAG TPA: ABC transporter ATP-binding protein [Bosea sp. (in: a-proteobacteria)]|jgi:branched-chain amino acid transport system ATP-binding protein|uniref:ABC transporter ATP-binding protein n=1 Tax=Bosea sp. (in: a-proteobacteria) TaxID=1871050 RepID=UPI002E139403|nr:ABC transporter ATP-binding protein [Bosea sp. (in: a-proteobacteria)]